MTIATVADLYPPKWVKAPDLQGKAVTVKIAAVTVEDLRMPDGTRKCAAILAFERASRRLILNRTMCRALIEITGTERLQEWVGHSVVLAPSMAPNNRPTIDIRRAENGQ